MEKKYGFQADYAVAPGSTLKEVLDEKGMMQADLAVRTGLAEKTISQIVNGVAPITYETSGKLEMATGVPAAFWNRREAAYREALERAEQTEKLCASTGWLKEIPLKILIDRGYVQATTDRAAQVRESLRFFGVSSVEAWRSLWCQPVVQYRGVGTQHRKPGFLAAWVRLGEIKAQGRKCEAFDADKFRQTLARVRSVTSHPGPKWQEELESHCSAAGVAVVFVREIQDAHVSGLTRWLTKDKAIIQLSLKYKRDDQLWFTFFHEAGHILLHGKRSVFIERRGQASTAEEREADAFARDFLIPPAYGPTLRHLEGKTAICSFAKELGISPGIVVGRLQHDRRLPMSHYNDLKLRVDWAASP